MIAYSPTDLILPYLLSFRDSRDRKESSSKRKDDSRSRSRSRSVDRDDRNRWVVGINGVNVSLLLLEGLVTVNVPYMVVICTFTLWPLDPISVHAISHAVPLLILQFINYTYAGTEIDLAVDLALLPATGMMTKTRIERAPEGAVTVAPRRTWNQRRKIKNRVPLRVSLHQDSYAALSSSPSPLALPSICIPLVILFSPLHSPLCIFSCDAKLCSITLKTY